MEKDMADRKADKATGTSQPQGKTKFDLIERGVKEPSPAGTLTFVGLRVLDLPLQYALLRPDGPGVRLLQAMGVASSWPLLRRYGAGLRLLGHTGLGPLDGLGPAAIPLLMAAGSTVKQLYWLLVLSNESFPALTAALPVAFYNTALNGVNALLFLALPTTSLRSRPGPVGPWPLPLAVLAGSVLYLAGMALETVSERQRQLFKAEPGNRGRVCTVGLWRHARHVNYLGYAMWRAGYCMATSGWLAGLAMGLLQGADLATRAAHNLDVYCTDRYGDQWLQYKRDVPYRIIPRLY